MVLGKINILCCISGIAILLFASFVYFAEKDYLAPDIR
jgi:hypothetical protein